MNTTGTGDLIPTQGSVGSTYFHSVVIKEVIMTQVSTPVHNPCRTRDREVQYREMTVRSERHVGLLTCMELQIHVGHQR